MTTLIIIQSGITMGISNDGRSPSKILYTLLKGQGPDSLRNLVSAGQNTVHPPTTTPPMPPGCHYNGQYYPPNSEIYKDEDRQSNWCHGAFCDGQGQVLHWDNFNCFPSTTPPTTTAPTTTPPTTTAPATTPPTTPPLDLCKSSLYIFLHYFFPNFYCNVKK